MITQPAALRLADELEIKAKALGFSLSPHAAELRRLHEVNAELLKALKLCQPYARAAMEAVGGMNEYNATHKADIVIAKATKDQA